MRPYTDGGKALKIKKVIIPMSIQARFLSASSVMSLSPVYVVIDKADAFFLRKRAKWQNFELAFKEIRAFPIRKNIDFIAAQ